MVVASCPYQIYHRKHEVSKRRKNHGSTERTRYQKLSPETRGNKWNVKTIKKSSDLKKLWCQVQHSLINSTDVRDPPLQPSELTNSSRVSGGLFTIGNFWVRVQNDDFFRKYFFSEILKIVDNSVQKHRGEMQIHHRGFVPTRIRSFFFLFTWVIYDLKCM